MKITSVYTKFVSSQILKGVIHGQGQNKTYCFIIVETTSGRFLSELYCGTYNRHIVEACIQTINEKLRKASYFETLECIRTELHIPFISGNGIYEACTSAVLNAVESQLTSTNLPHTWCGEYYYSGGTVKTSISQLYEEIEYAVKSGYNVYKIRLDYRDPEDCINKISILNAHAISYSVDFIVNTNISNNYHSAIQNILEYMYPEKVCWIEEPTIPSRVVQDSDYLRQIRDRGFKLALGESFTSILEFQAIDKLDLIDVIQLDATISSTVPDFVEFGSTCNARLGFHNWGSVFGMLQNMSVAQKIGKFNYFEIPYYQTAFDNELIGLLATSVIHELDINEVNLDRVVAVIEKYSVETNDNFSWT